MKELLEHGRMIELILALMLLEAVFLTFWHKFTGRGIAPIQFVANLAAGTFLMLAILAALQNASLWTLAACLFAAFLAHLADLALRWQESDTAPTPFGEIIATKHRMFERSL